MEEDNDENPMFDFVLMMIRIVEAETGSLDEYVKKLWLTTKDAITTSLGAITSGGTTDSDIGALGASVFLDVTTILEDYWQDVSEGSDIVEGVITILDRRAGATETAEVFRGT